jgi:hypothetical protein
LTAIRRQGDDIAARAGAGKRRGLASRVATAGLGRMPPSRTERSLTLRADDPDGAAFRDHVTRAFAIAGLARLAIGGEINDNFMNNFDELQAR